MNVRKYVAFDLEIAKSIPDDAKDWKDHRPLGITCAAAVSSDGLWNWYANEGGLFTDKMDVYTAEDMVLTLMGLVNQGGYTILTWNGLGFDFDVLAEESEMIEECKELALNHVDMMFHFFCGKGFPLGLDAASKGMGLPGKPEGMSGAKAPELWANGQYHKVLAYCSLDVKNTLGVAQAVQAAGQLNWISRAGRPNSWRCDRWLTVAEAMDLPEPDTSWMSDPLARETFYGWSGFSPTVIAKPVGNIWAGALGETDWDLADTDEADE